jgi:hypothetical protein
MTPGARGALTSTYLGRYFLWLQPTNSDHLRMPQRALAASPAPVALSARVAPAVLDSLPILSGKAGPALPLAKLLADSGTTALVVLHQGMWCGNTIRTAARASG